MKKHFQTRHLEHYQIRVHQALPLQPALINDGWPVAVCVTMVNVPPLPSRGRIQSFALVRSIRIIFASAVPDKLSKTDILFTILPTTNVPVMRRRIMWTRARGNANVREVTFQMRYDYFIINTIFFRVFKLVFDLRLCHVCT